jgi:CheY-like chemotaxis protein
MEAIGVLAGGVAHDFNNILTAIAGYSDLALQHIQPDDPLREYISEIIKAGDRAAALTRQLLSFGRRGRMTPSVHNLNDSITETQRMLKRIVRENINFHIDLAPDLHNIKVDASQIAQVIVNLVVNAGDAMPEGGTLTITTQNTHLEGDFVHDNVVVTSGPFVELMVRDTGVGMDEMTLRRLFEPFFTTKESGKGTGLGLSTVYGIVRQSGGDVSVQSEVGKGTTFRVFLPAADEVRNETQVSRSKTSPPENPATILLVEDEDSVRNLVCSILTRHGYDVLTAECGERAVEVCRSSDRQIDLLLTDMIMPGMNGLMLQQSINEIRPGLKAIIMSGYTGETLEKTTLLDPDVSFIGKPFSPEDIVTTVSAALSAKPTKIALPHSLERSRTASNSVSG